MGRREDEEEEEDVFDAPPRRFCDRDGEMDEGDVLLGLRVTSGEEGEGGEQAAVSS